MLGELVALFKKFLGGLVESGEQWLSWIHQQDLVRAYLFLPDHPELSGPVNFTSSNPMRNRDFARALRMGVVFQESFLFNHSIRENLRLGRADATDAEIKTAARAAEIHEAIMEMPKRYDTMVGERGGTLSGGQCQRLAIARALLNDPEILILDEATSALDPDTEEAISATLEQIGILRTVLMVSHRLVSVRHMDRIVVLDHGRIIEQGRYDELIKKTDSTPDSGSSRAAPRCAKMVL